MEWNGSKGRSGPIPDAKIKKAACKLEEALASEKCYNLNYSERKPWEVSMEARDGAVQVLRFLKVWFDAPEGVFFSAVHYLDQFLALMKVQERFLPCVTISCFNVAADLNGLDLNASQLVMLTQSRCSVKDMQRMSSIIKRKLGLKTIDDHHTVLEVLHIFLELIECVAVQFDSEALLNTMLRQEELYTRLEILLTDSTTAIYKPSMLTHAFIKYEMERFLSNEIPNKSNYYTKEMFYLLAVMIELHTLCKMDSVVYTSCSASVADVLNGYDGMQKSRLSQSQKLSWRFSSSTLASSKHSQNFYSPLNSVDEE